MSKTALLHELPPEVLRFLTQALVLAGSAEDDTAVRKKYLDQVRSGGSLIRCCLVTFSRVLRRYNQSGKLYQKNSLLMT